MFRCSNPACLALHKTDPQGHCPSCLQAGGTGWSCVADVGFECSKCGRKWPAGQLALKCVTCGAVYCPACKNIPSVHSFGCYQSRTD